MELKGGMMTARGKGTECSSSLETIGFTMFERGEGAVR